MTKRVRMRCDALLHSFHKNGNFEKFEILFTTDSLQSQSPMIDTENSEVKASA